MSEDFLQYDKMVEAALKGVVRSALQVVEKHGLMGAHHFYITFRTDFAGVQIPPYLKEKYPEEMTIVLQYQFSNLDIKTDFFSVNLSFNNVEEYLKIPFAAITGFADPSVKFGLQFHNDEFIDDDDDELMSLAILEDEMADDRTPPPPAKKGRPSSKDKGNSDTGGSKVVSLDEFRKK